MTTYLTQIEAVEMPALRATVDLVAPLEFAGRDAELAKLRAVAHHPYRAAGRILGRHQ